MTVNYTTLLGLAQPVTGTEAGTWGTVVNNEITALVEEAIARGASINVTAGDVTLTTTTGASNQARNAILLITGTPGVSRNVIAPSSSKVYIIVNGSNAAVVIKGAATTGVTVATGATSLVAWNGSDFVEVGQAGDVDGPASSTANAIARFSGTTGKIIQNSGITIDASNNVTGMGTLSSGAITSSSLTSGRVLYAGTSGLIQDSANLTFNGTTLTANDITDSSLTSGRVTYAGASGNLTDSANLTFNGTTLTANTIGAFTLGGTISGGGNQINNIVIGASTPLAGSFTTLSASGVATFSAGTVSAPAITTTGDTNTGIFFPAADTIGFAEGGVEAMRIDSSGNVGIGVTPSAWTATGAKAIQVGTYASLMSGTSTGYTDLGHNIYGNYSYLQSNFASFYRQISGQHQWFTAPSGTAGNAITFTQAMTLDASGNLGIGTISPWGYGGNISITGAGRYISSTSNDIRFGSNVYSDGSSSKYAAAGNAELYRMANGTHQWFIAGSGSANATITFTQAMTLDASGNLGIGTSSPAQRLEVYNSATNSQCYAIFQNNRTRNAAVLTKTTNGGFYTGTSIGTDTLCWQVYDDVAGERMRIDSSGRVGINTSSPTAPLTVQANTSAYAIDVIGRSSGDISAITFKNNANNTELAQIQSGSTYLFFSTGGSERMRIDSSGNVGIGTSSPGYKLDVSGSSATVARVISSADTSILRVDATGANTRGGAVDLVQAGTLRGRIGVSGTWEGNTSSDMAVASEAGLRFYSGGSGTERARITSGGYFKASNDGAYVSSTGTYHEFVQSANAINLYMYSKFATLSSAMLYQNGLRSASTAYNFLLAYSGDGADLEFQMRGDGNAYADGTWNNNGADYAEFFESANGQALTLGATVVLDGNKVREATDQDPASAIIGVVRPKEPSKASMVVGNTAWNKWANKYLTDDFDRYIMEDHDVVEWEEQVLEREAVAAVEAVVDEEGNEVSPAAPAQEAVYKTKQHSYESHNIPAGVTVPADATRKTHDDKGNKFQHYKLNPAWDKDAEYVNRENRPEWNIIGLLGQVKILKGQPIGDRWIKMRDVSATVEEWMIR